MLLPFFSIKHDRLAKFLFHGAATVIHQLTSQINHDLLVVFLVPAIGCYLLVEFIGKDAAYKLMVTQDVIGTILFIEVASVAIGEKKGLELFPAFKLIVEEFIYFGFIAMSS